MELQKPMESPGRVDVFCKKIDENPELQKNRIILNPGHCQITMNALKM